jgi:hypothetical protein
MRTFGRPSPSTVASDMAVGSFGSDCCASAIQSRKIAQGSAASAKSSFLNVFAL